MSRTIYKYPFSIESMFELSLPFGAMVIHAGLDPAGQPCLWAEFDKAKSSVKEIRPFFCVGTGQSLNPMANAHIGSFVQGPFVWHIYE
jgi:hypothetical protein